MTAEELVEDVQQNLSLLNNDELWSDEEIFANLQSSYIQIQKDIVIFQKVESFEVFATQNELQIENLLKLLSVFVEGNEYRLISFDEFVKSDEEFIATNNFANRVIFYPASEKKTTVKVAYQYIQVLDNIRCKINIPLHYIEALRLLLLSKLHEKDITENFNKSNFYLKKYEIEIQKIKKYLKPKRTKITKSSYIKF
jgi:hypothetical protein